MAAGLAATAGSLLLFASLYRDPAGGHGVDGRSAESHLPDLLR
jgi:hypothetical protein